MCSSSRVYGELVQARYLKEGGGKGDSKAVPPKVAWLKARLSGVVKGKNTQKEKNLLAWSQLC